MQKSYDNDSENNFDAVQTLREQNQQLKSKMARLNLALDKAMTENKPIPNKAPSTQRSDSQSKLEMLVHQ